MENFYAQMEPLRNVQQQNEQLVDDLSSTLEESRIACAVMMYGNLGILMDKYRDNTSRVENFFELQLIRETGSDEEEPEPIIPGETIVFAVNVGVNGKITFSFKGKDGKQITINHGDGTSGTVILQELVFADYEYIYPAAAHYQVKIGGDLLAVTNLVAKKNNITGSNYPDNLPFLVEVDISDNDMGSYHTPDTHTGMLNLNAKNNRFDQQSINATLITYDDFGTNNGTLDLRGPNMAIPTGDGLTAKANLESRGWIVRTN